MLRNRSLFVCAALIGLCWCTSAAAIEPAGGAAEKLAAPAMDEPDASVSDKGWFEDAVERGAGEGSARALGAPNVGMAATALALLLALAGTAVWLRKRRAALGPLPEAEARLKVLASSRVGPKAFAVTASVGGRVMLLGVTDHNVSHLAWLESPPPAPPTDPITALDVQDDDLPDDYPGSALREAARTSGIPPAEGGRWGTSEANLRRFQEVLRDAAKRHPGAEPDPVELSDPASVLADQTRDLLGDLPMAVEPRAASLRRKRNGRKSLPSAAPATPDNEPEIEGQVAGLKALRKT
jgi:flagellar biogenesis protein FliO